MLPQDREHGHLTVKANPVRGRSEKPVSRADRNEVFLFVGRPTPEKGISKLIREFSQHKDLKLEIIGTGPLEPEDARLINASENISCTPALTQTALGERMATSLAVLVPSLWVEPFGRVAAESLGAGTPAIVSNSGGLTEIVSGISNDISLDAKDIEDLPRLARKLSQLTAEEYDKLAVLCHRKWEENFTAEALALELVSIYKRAMRSDADYLEK
ncbi:glycosyltransferase [Leucobacter sp. Z1108]|uniref:glycosyltransferase n=1 Tax=Leucobacter sp. Z1108 TaxID=3439066 RepID=UPI003F2BC5AE